MHARSVLILDEDVSLRPGLESGLFPLYQVSFAIQGTEARQLMESCAVDLCVISSTWAEANGSEVLQEMRSRFPDASWVGLRDSENGTLDLEFPCLMVLDRPLTVERLRDCLERLLPPLPPSHPEMILDPEAHSVLLEGRTILLTPIEFRILSELWNARGTLVRRDEICAKLWGTTRVTEHTFDTHFSNMKKKMPELRDRIQVIRSRGYILLP